MSSPATAQRLYYDSPALEFTAHITDIRLVSKEPTAAPDNAQLWQVALDRTAFYPEGGGQPWDTGVLIATAPSGATLEIPVERVEEDEHGEIWHFVRKPLTAGTEITGHIDPDRRTDHEQQHSGQHLLSAVFLRELSARTVSFHLGAESSTIDLALAEGIDKLSEEDLRRVEESANRILYENRPMLTHWVERPLAEAMLARGELRKLPPLEGPFRIVQMQGIEFNACGGTHVANTGAIGSILLRRVEKVRQGWRVEFVCGLRAVRTARREFATLGAASKRLSIAGEIVPQRVSDLLEEVKTLSKRQIILRQAIAQYTADELTAHETPGKFITPIFGDDLEFAKWVTKRLISNGFPAIVAAESPESGGVVLAFPSGSSYHAGKILKEVAAEAGLRAGGSAEIAQCGCSPDLAVSLHVQLQKKLGGW